MQSDSRITVRLSHDPPLEWSEDPSSSRQLFPLHIPNVIALRLRLLAVGVEPRDDVLMPKIGLDLLHRHGVLRDASVQQLGQISFIPSVALPHHEKHW